ncbi:alpha-amylase family protein [Arthrobacter sp. R4]|uniref:alpha-amylase family protein n=1 Tax=Arthrobacter sp. R4 TaxID=644417 RepID=UPI003ED9F2B3
MPTNPTTSERDLPPDSRWHEPFGVLQTNLQEIDAGMDVEAAIDAVVEYGADTWLLNAGGISSFYPTELSFQTRNPLLDQRESGDLLGDAVAAAKQRGIKIIARFDMSKVAPRIAAAHPEWLYRSADGEPQIYNNLYSTCPSGEYYQSRSFDVLDEVLGRYDVDAVFFNQFNFNERDYDEVMYGPCHCEGCMEGFAKFSNGSEHPRDMSSPTFGMYRQYTAATLTQLTTRIVDYVADRNEDVGVILRRGAPIEYVEGNNHYKAMPGNELWPHAVAEAVSAHVSSRPGSALMVNCVAFVDNPYRLANEEPEHFAQYLVQATARGGNPSAYFFGAPGRLPMEPAISVGRDVMQFRARNRQLYAGLRPAADVALVRPDHGSAPRGYYWSALEEFRGFYLALQEGHIPFDIVPVDRVSTLAENGSLARYRLVVLPDIGTLRDGSGAVDEYVKGGGALLMTGSSGLSHAGSVELASAPALQALVPVLEGNDLRSTFVTESPQPRIDEYHYAGPLIPVFGRYQRFAWKPGALKVGAVLPRAPFGPPELCYGHVMSGDPGAVRATYGRGSVLHVPWTVGRSYREFVKSESRDHIINLVRSMWQPSVTTDIHESVEMILGQSGKSTVVHLINHSGARRRSYRPHIPISGGHLRLIGQAGAKVAAHALVGGASLSQRNEGNDLVFDLPTLNLFQVVTITPV